MTLSVVIPTKNRPQELLSILDSIGSQTHLPNQLIIIDQSLNENTIEDKINLIFKNKILLNYIHDQTINGLVSAKSNALKFNKCDIISFFDDDIILEPDYLKEIFLAFKKNPNIRGANGVILNIPNQNIIKRLIYKYTHIGLFRDNRIDKNKKAKNDSSYPLNVNALSGGLSSWRSEIFKSVKFDTLNNLHSFEDIDFSVRFEAFSPKSMFLIPKARLYHFHAETNRNSNAEQIISSIEECILIFKKNKNLSFFGIDLLLILFYYKIISLYLMVKHNDINFLFSYIKGVRFGLSKGIKN